MTLAGRGKRCVHTRACTPLYNTEFVVCVRLTFLKCTFYTYYHRECCDQLLPSVSLPWPWPVRRSQSAATLSSWSTGSGPQWVRTDPAPPQRSGWGSCRQTAGVVVQCRVRPHHPQCRWQSQQQDRRDQRWDPHRDEQTPCNKHTAVDISCNKHTAVDISCNKHTAVDISCNKYTAVDISCNKHTAIDISCNKHVCCEI